MNSSLKTRDIYFYNNGNPVIRQGSEVVMQFCISLSDGTVVEGSRGSEPLRLVIGDGTLLESLERLLVGMKTGESRSFHLQPEQAYGLVDPDNVHPLVRSEFAPDMDLEPGQIIGFTTPSGDEVPGTVVEVHDDTVVVDLNHPLAGQAIFFDVEILKVSQPL